MRSPQTEKYLPKKLTGEELDDYLARGWYRMGCEVFTCQFLYFKEKLYSPVWIRLPLKDYEFKKRLRKLFNRNRRKFQVIVRPLELNKEKEDLYQKYRKHFHSWIGLTLIDNLQEGNATTVFDTYEACIYEGEKLVGCSFFDLGNNSLTSILGMYDPDYQQDSLGFYTMLLEIEYGKEKGFEFYYPGYIVPYYPAFDYKLRIGTPEDIEYFDLRTEEWMNYSSFDKNNTLTIETGNKLNALGKLLTINGVSSTMLFFPCYDPYLVMMHDLENMMSPLFLSCFSDIFMQPQYLVYYNYFDLHFYFYDCTLPEEESAEMEDNFLPEENAAEMLNFVKHQKLIFKSLSIVDMAATVKRHQLKVLAKSYASSDDKKEKG